MAGGTFTKRNPQQFSKQFYRRRRRERCINLCVCLAILFNIVVWFFVSKFWHGYFSLGNVMAVLITLINIAAITIQFYVFEQAAKGEEKGIIIWWLCCLKCGGSKRLNKKRSQAENQQEVKRETEHLTPKLGLSP